MPSSRKRKELVVAADDLRKNEDYSNSEDIDYDDDDDDDKNEVVVPTSLTAVANGNATTTKLKCLKCYRAARKDCTGSLCIRCCTDETCAVHKEQRAKAEWKKAVVLGTTEFQRAAKTKRARKIPKGRFKEEEFQYMNDTVVLWDLRSVLEPSPRRWQQQCQHQQALPLPSSTQAPRVETGTPTRLASSDGVTPAIAIATTTTPTPLVSASANAEYQNDVKVRDEILRRSRKNNSSRAVATLPVEGATRVRRNKNGTKKGFRGLMEDLYQRSLD
mmetsp:Transcript_16451/g.35821  ORF Transcript_16451/g.35821 Transcript_16451/m.35821 type:complete len:274 (+) Transcript_16451:111-932(+)|eukprot:CAMPEP_0168248400 /NCGR_PEP_ID=MMETSP0141_2-20121125/1437_1 /TAXON_ID=44445 /ORGANISM="Pseudo-nitzschia australis, Strain 10249 10 AB" /LENGTH=273 /DNA_ID=CAMNT_0008184303 /DNA_START=20 /DNA_END=841 /DNA_ORIENTATION=+